jgi:tetratricopeptide (TPR) repeat protein
MLVGLQPAQGQAASGYMGADAVLKQADAARAERKARGTAGTLAADVEALPARYAKLTPREAASQWWALCERMRKSGGQQTQPDDQTQPVTYGTILGAMPPPADWGAVADLLRSQRSTKKIEQARDAVLHLIADTLVNPGHAQRADVAEIRSSYMAASQGQAQSMLAPMLGPIEQELAKQSGDPRTIVETLVQAAQTDNGQGEVAVPDLVALLGKQQAEIEIRKLLVTARVQLDFPERSETIRIARRIALASTDKLKVAQWNLASDVSATALYEALHKRFPNTKPNEAQSYTPNSNPDAKAKGYYFCGLIIQGRLHEAEKLLGEIDPNVVNQWTQPHTSSPVDDVDAAGKLDGLFTVIQDGLRKSSKLPYWDVYAQAAGRLGRQNVMLADLKTAVERATWPPTKASLEALRAHLLLVFDHVDEAIALMRQSIADSASAPAGGQMQGYTESVDAMMLARLGAALNRPALMEEGIADAKRGLDGSGTTQFEATALADFLEQHGRGPEAEAVIAKALGMLSAQEIEGMGGTAQQMLTELAGIYLRAGRPEDVISLLEHAPGWGGADLVDILGTVDLQDNPIGYIAAQALADTGHPDIADTLVRAVLSTNVDCDPAYQLLLKLEGEKALPYLDRLAAQHRFESRPLIWKAADLQQLGRMQEAETTARAAIALDPTDGTSRFGRRLKAYAVLGDIRAAAGDEKEAQNLREIVRAVRIGEQGDDLADAGLILRAQKLYDEALKHFADAYCIHFRLAVQLVKEGRPKEAAEHYRRAYELMPSQFGRMESYCFGCESAFQGHVAQNIALQVFTEMLIKMPNKPQVHYLMGNLMLEEERWAEAVTQFEAAVKLDPDYVNAWSKLSEASQHEPIPPKLNDSIALNLIRLNYGGGAGNQQVSEVTDLRALWNAVEAAGRQVTPQPKALYRLPASALAMSSSKSERWRERFNYMDMQNRANQAQQTPGQIIAGTSVLSGAASLLDMFNTPQMQ